MSAERHLCARRTAAAAVFVLSLLLGAPAFADPLPIDPAWSADPVWDDGLAEMSLYDAERVVYGTPRPHEARMIVVKEDFSDAEHVKADPPYEGKSLTTVLKVNLVSTIRTENYPYHYLASIFVRRDDVRTLVKATVGSQEWCGNVFKEVLTWGGPPRIHFHSYFEGQGDGEQPLPLGEDGLLDEQLLIALRASSLPEGERAALRVADSIVTNAARPVALREATLTAGALEEVETPAGRIRARRYELRVADGRTAAYWIAQASSRALVRMEASDGRKLVLRQRARADYWSR